MASQQIAVAGRGLLARRHAGHPYAATSGGRHVAGWDVELRCRLCDDAALRHRENHARRGLDGHPPVTAQPPASAARSAKTMNREATLKRLDMGAPCVAVRPSAAGTPRL